jgi:hypothetical protein
MTTTMVTTMKVSILLSVHPAGTFVATGHFSCLSLASLEEQCALFNLSLLDVLSVGCKSICMKNAKNKRAAAPLTGVDTNAVMLPSGFKHGIGMKEKIAIMHLVQQQMMATTRIDDLEFETMSKTTDLLKDELNFALAIVHELRIMDKDDDAGKNVFELKKRLTEQNIELQEYQTRKRHNREEEKSKGLLFKTFILSVNCNYHQ